MLRRHVLTMLTLAALTGRATASPSLRLLMIERAGCIHCRAWMHDIGPGYADSVQGRRAPLLRIDIDGPFPDGLALARTPWVTPTFILIRDRQELSRIEGYPGADHFYPMLTRMMAGLPPI